MLSCNFIKSYKIRLDINKIVLVFLFISICSCHNSSNVYTPDNTIIIDLDHLEEGEQFQFSDLYKSCEAMLNENGEVIELKSWTCSFRYDGVGHYLVYDNLSSHVQAKLYTLDGAEICEIGNKGKDVSKGEWLEINDAVLNAKNGVIYLLSNRQGMIFKFNYKGKYLGYIPVITKNTTLFYEADPMSAGRICDKIALTPQGDLLIHYAWWDGNQSPYNYCLVDSIGNIISTRKTFRSFNGYTPHRPEMSSYIFNDKLHVLDLSDTLYVVDGNKFIPKYIFKSKYSFNDLIGDNQKKIVVNKVAKNIPQVIISASETKDYLFFSKRFVGGDDKDVYSCYLNKQTGRAYKLPTSRMPFTYTPDSLALNLSFMSGDDTIMYKPFKQRLYKFRVQ